MNKPKIKVFRIELAICMLVPALVLMAIVLLGYGFVGREKNEVMRRFKVLDEIPLLESRLAAAQKSLSGFRMVNGGKENGEWSHRVSQAAANKGVAVKSVNTEKNTTQVMVSCNDYRIQASGEGRMGAVVGWVDQLDQPARCFKIATLKMRPVKSGQSALYEVESVINARSIAMHSQPGEPLVGQFEPALDKLNSLTLAVNTLAKTKWQELDTRVLDARAPVDYEANALMAPLAPLTLKLNGIVKDVRKPLALTDRGVLGEGDLIDGYKVIHVGLDRLVLENQMGVQNVVLLYQTEGNP